MEAPIKVTATDCNTKPVEVVYNEASNQWEFTLRGRERRAPSLEKAREIIGKPPPKSEEPFDRVIAWWKCYEGWIKVEITSIASGGYSWRGPEVWISYEMKGSRRQRSKVSANELFPVSEKNDALITEIEATKHEIEALRNREEAIMKKLRPYTPPKAGAEEEK